MSESETEPVKPAGTGGNRTRLDRRAILEAGVEFIEKHGLRQLTMRQLGAHLGVEAMSLYRHVPSRDNLLDGIVDLVIDELYGDPEVYLEPRHGWQDYLIRLAHGLRRLALRHPQIFPLVATRPPQAPWIRPPLRSLRWIDSFLGALTSSGFRDEAAVRAYRAFSSFLLGHLLLEVAAQGAEIGPLEKPAGDVLPDLELESYPMVRRLRKSLSEDRSADEFEESLENLLERLGSLI